MTFPLAIFLYIFYAFLLVWFIFCAVAVYHMVSYGFKTFLTFLTTVIFIAFSVILLLVVFNFIGKVDWQTSISIFEGISNNSLNY